MSNFHSEDNTMTLTESVVQDVNTIELFLLQTAFFSARVTTIQGAFHAFTFCSCRYFGLDA